MNLRAAFVIGIESQLSAQQVFTNRVPDIDAFWVSLKSLRESLSNAEVAPVVDRSAPRRNVLVYYGVGGIGKTTLSHELERRYLEQGSRNDRRAAVRLDFAEVSAFDLESYVLRLRAGLAQLSPRWPAFDLALKVYWDRAHPGEPLEEFISSGSTMRRFARSAGLSEQISESIAGVVGDALLGGVAGIAYNLGSSTLSHTKEAVAGHRVVRKCEMLPVLLDADATVETLSYFPYLLAWDLDQVSLRQRNAVVFLDTYENLTARGGREAEKLLQRSVFLMPNVLFVITGRDRLDWGDLQRADELDFVGAERWPNLAVTGSDAEPRQHLVGYLSAQDAHSYLAGAVSREGQPAIPQDIREQIVSASAGLPLYLDLAVNTFLEVISRGRVPTAADFGQPLPTVTARMIRDLDRDERTLLRAAALVGRFSLATLRAGCPHVPDAALLRFRDRLFLELDPERIWPYSLHDVLREAILEADIGLPDSWSPRERAEVALRMATHLRDVVTSAKEASDRSLQTAAFQQAVDLGISTRQFFDWLVDAAQGLVASGVWSFMTKRAPDDAGAIAAFLLGLAGVQERRSGQLSTAISLVNRALSRPVLTDELRHFLVLHRAHALRVAGRYAEAADDYAVISRESSSFSADGVYWLADYSFLDGRFNDALAALDTLSNQPPELHGEILRLRGHVYRVNALFAIAEGHYRAALELARDTCNAAGEGKALTDIVQTLAWYRPQEVADPHAKAVEINERIRNRVELVKLHAAMAVAATGLGEFEAARREIDAGLELTEDCGYPGGQIWCWVARAFHAVRQDDPDGCQEAARRVAEIADRVGGNRFWGEVTRWWGGVDSDTGSGTRWIDDVDAARQRWQLVATDRSAHA